MSDRLPGCKAKCPCFQRRFDRGWPKDWHCWAYSAVGRSQTVALAEILCVQRSASCSHVPTLNKKGFFGLRFPRSCPGSQKPPHQSFSMRLIQASLGLSQPLRPCSRTRKRTHGWVRHHHTRVCCGRWRPCAGLRTISTKRHWRLRDWPKSTPAEASRTGRSIACAPSFFPGIRTRQRPSNNDLTFSLLSGGFTRRSLKRCSSTSCLRRTRRLPEPASRRSETGFQTLNRLRSLSGREWSGESSTCCFTTRPATPA